MENITLIASKRITYIISVWHRLRYLLLTQILNLTMPSFHSRKATDWRFFCNDSIVWLAIRRICNELHRISCYHLAKAHIQRTQAKASFYYRQSVLSSPITYPTLAHHRKRTSKALRMLLAQILTYRTPTRCNAPSQWGTDFCGLKSPSLANSHGFYRPKPIEADLMPSKTSEESDAFDVSHIQ